MPAGRTRAGRVDLRLEKGAAGGRVDLLLRQLPRGFHALLRLLLPLPQPAGSQLVSMLVSMLLYALKAVVHAA